MREFKNIPYSLEVEVTHNLREKAPHGSPLMPLAVYIDDFRKYSSPVIQHHWHPEIQLAYILKGSVEYEFYGKKFLLNKDDGLFINSNILHMSITHDPENTQMITILFNPSILSGINQIEIENEYISPVISCKDLKYILFTNKIYWHRQILKKIPALIYSEEQKEFGYKLEQKNIIGEIWLAIIRNSKDIISSNNTSVSIDEDRIKIMLQFINENYTKNITLNEIASSANLSKSECCRCFKRTIKISPFTYLIQKRIFSSVGLLSTTNYPISYISERVGFNEISNFYKTFKSIMNMTPAEFREKEKHIKINKNIY